MAFLQYLGILAWPIIAIGWITNLFQRGLASLKRIQALLDARPDITPPEKPVAPVKVSGGIEFNRVDFAYNKEVPVLKSISMDISPGMKIGITGPPGSGKTSLIQLIPRLYDPVQGRVCLDGQDLTRLDTEFLRQQIALMPQEPFLFSGTLRENILMGRRVEDTGLQEIIDVCDLELTIAEMPDGLATIVGERGVTLSGGQKQRVALARTLIADTPVLLLDDPVSQLDTQTAQNVIDRINRRNPEATMIMVSHRLSALAGCDRIYILDKGIISDQGTHDRLKETNAFYRESYRVQQFEEVAHV